MSDMGFIDDRIENERPLLALLVFVLGATIIGGAIDLYLDAPESWWSAHLIYELALIVIAIATSVTLWRGWWRSRRMLVESRQIIETQAAERAAWRASAESALADFARAVDQRFDAWALTPSEREIALRLLKGHSHKQIAFETGRSERTVRQHAVAVYDKSGLGGRAELAAFFLEDLLLPAGPSEAAPALPLAGPRSTG